ncbi:PREDICTED: uncharacterized protein LOC105452231 isoform X2 [Wasmannia auropunctata]|uniref:uncharacterized protein LOC105452231 isoform X2 n=1 Tax=Wasmannia auropunctata TaxID=64793 RepID=UPI0005EF5623|nr:PREDICTED: uncharacterized protein LOC105452231 isoform X2 [Wasmannia auropunctata]
MSHGRNTRVCSSGGRPLRRKPAYVTHDVTYGHLRLYSEWFVSVKSARRKDMFDTFRTFELPEDPATTTTGIFSSKSTQVAILMQFPHYI